MSRVTWQLCDTYKEVVRELVLTESDDAQNIPALMADLSVRGVWQPQTVALLDVRVIDTDAQSYVDRSVDAILSSAEHEENILKQDMPHLHPSCYLLTVLLVGWLCVFRRNWPNISPLVGTSRIQK